MYLVWKMTTYQEEILNIIRGRDNGVFSNSDKEAG